MSWFRRKRAVENINTYLFYRQVCKNCDFIPKDYKSTPPLKIDILDGCGACKPKEIKDRCHICNIEGYNKLPIYPDKPICFECYIKVKLKDRYNPSGPGSHFDVNVNVKVEVDMKCRHCFIEIESHKRCCDKCRTDRHKNGLCICISGCGIVHESPWICCDSPCCKSCGREIETHRTYCASCINDKPKELPLGISEGACDECDISGYIQNFGSGDIVYPCGRISSRSNNGDYLQVLPCQPKKEAPKMKEFDLRPFEVVKLPKRRVVYIIDYNNAEGHVNGPDCAKYFESPAEAIESLKKTYSEKMGDDFYYLQSIESILIKRKVILEEPRTWTFEDIQVGWFFQSSNKQRYIKVSATEYKYWDSKDGRIYISNQASVFGEVDIKITNVYDCPELAKVLMIERIIT